MAYLHRVPRKGINYWSISTTVRNEAGKPREKVLLYIGNDDKLKEWVVNAYETLQKSPGEGLDTDKLTGDFLNGLTMHTESHGAPVALYRIAMRLGIPDILDEVFGKKKICGMSGGYALTLVSVYQAICPGNGCSFSEWIKTTSLPYHLGLDLTQLSSDEIWHAVDGITSGQDDERVDRMLEETQMRIAGRLLELHREMKELHLAYINRITTSVSTDTVSSIRRRGHNRQEQFGIDIVMPGYMQFPLAWRVYPDNDKTEFSVNLQKLHKSLEKLGLSNPDKTLLVFDGGRVSTENLKDLPLGFVCAVSCYDDTLYNCPLEEYEEVESTNGGVIRAHLIGNYSFSGINGSGLMLFSQALRDSEAAELEAELRDAAKDLAAFNEKQRNEKSRLTASLRAKEKASQKAADEVERMRKEIDQAKAAGADARKRLNETKEALKMLRLASDGAEAGNDSDPELMQALKTAEEALIGIQSSYDEHSALARKMQKLLEEECRTLEKESVFDRKTCIMDEAKAIAYSGRENLEAFTTLEVRSVNGAYRVSLVIDEAAKAAFVEKYFGKKLLFTNVRDIDAKAFLIRYLSGWDLEELLDAGNNPDRFSVWTQDQWADGDIRVRVFLSLLAHTLTEELLAYLESQGITGYTKAGLLDALSHIHDGWINETKEGEKKHLHRFMEEIEDENLRKLWDAVETLPCKIGSYA